MNMPWKNQPALAPVAQMPASVVLAATAQTVKTNGHNFASLIDELGTLRADIKKLATREKELTGLVESLGTGEHDGTRCRAVVSSVTTMRLDTKSLTAVLPEELVKAHTKASQSVRVSIKALV